MPKIYLTSLHLMHGGTEFVIVQLANAFVERGFDVTILCTYYLGEPVYPLDKRVKIDYLTRLKPNRESLKTALEQKNIWQIVKEGLYATRVLITKKLVLIKAFRQIKDGTILSSRNEDTILLSLFGHKDVVKIGHIHHNIEKNDAVTKSLMKRYRHIDAVVFLTEELRDKAEQWTQNRKNQARYVAIANAITPLENPIQLKREKVILSVGRLHPEKGYTRLLNAFKGIHTHAPEWQLQIIGEGSLLPTLQEQVAQLELTEHVSFLGFLDNQTIRQKMLEASIYAMTSESEGFGIVLVEAMDAGLPLIAYDVPVGPRAIIANYQNGFLIENDNQSEFVQKTLALIKDEALREQFGKYSKNIAQKYTMDQVFFEWLALLASIKK
ncbi:glycosyltransferase [Enterococcus lemanii]|uniref:Glycosyltransferase n=1 Tax=Enterococcus lemanii TaxID=1159752 RepID=A0ABV9MRU2_9ENTE|nr:glycosyltransferase [Enterococcus lemanii]MBM7709072.1 N-acetylglucosaminyldiphosphoundecaprenol N-acetyl-beta-D-mannosaminyltransferase [Enterococcus lemanii]